MNGDGHVIHFDFLDPLRSHTPLRHDNLGATRGSRDLPCNCLRADQVRLSVDGRRGRNLTRTFLAMRSKGITIQRRAYRHGDLLAVAVQTAIEDIEAWINRHEINFTSSSVSHVLSKFQRLRHNAQIADGWLSGNFDSTITFKECCELLSQDHELCRRGVYERWAFISIQQLRSATSKTDYDDLDRVFPGKGRTLIPIDEIEAATEPADEDEEYPADNREELTQTTEGNSDASPIEKARARSMDRRRKLHKQSDQRTFSWGEDDHVPADRGERTEADGIHCTSGTGV